MKRDFDKPVYECVRETEMAVCVATSREWLGWVADHWRAYKRFGRRAFRVQASDIVYVLRSVHGETRRLELQ